MYHLVKFSLTHADLFVSSIDLSNKQIGVETRDKETGKLLTPKRIEAFQLMPDDFIHFAGGKLPIQILEYLHKTLN